MYSSIAGHVLPKVSFAKGMNQSLSSGFMRTVMGTLLTPSTILLLFLFVISICFFSCGQTLLSLS